MFRGNEFILELPCLFEGLVEGFLQGRGEVVLGNTAHLGQLFDGLLDLTRQGRGRDPQPLENARHNAFRLLYQSEQEVHGLQLLVAGTAGDLLRGLERLLRLDREFVKSCGHIGNSKFENRNSKVRMPRTSCENPAALSS